ncbi:hypothetical protein [Actinoplanes nipponensis]
MSDGTLRVEYFCYISRAKIDQLYEQVDPEAAHEITETRSRESAVKGEAVADWGIPHVLKLFKTGASYGRTGRIQREAKIKRTYLGKLERVLVAIAEAEPIPDAGRIGHPSARGSRFFHHEGELGLERPLADRSDTVVTLAGDLTGRPLLLDCSLRNFSEAVGPDGQPHVNSANHRFFTESMRFTMTTVFLLLEATADRVVGTPLFLKLSLPGADTLTAL